MDENVLFKNSSEPQTPSAEPVEPVQENPVAPQNQTAQPLESKPPISGFAKPAQKPLPPAGSPPQKVTDAPKSSKNPLIKLIIGVVAVILVTFLIIFFIPKGSPQKVKLVWWGLWEDSRVVQPVIDDFKRANPTIDIEYSKQDSKQYRERLTTRINNGTGPDIFPFHNTWYPMIYNITSPLPSDVITVDDFKKVYYPLMQKDLIHNGAIYGIPIAADTLSLFVNTELLDAAGVSVPVNWDQLVKAAKSLTVKDENGEIKTAGVALGTYGNITHAPDIISLLFVQQGINLDKFATFASDQTDVLDFYTFFAKGEDNTWNNNLDSSIILFSQGKLAMYFGYSWDIFAIQKLNKDLAFKVHPVPSLFDRNMTIGSYWVDGVSVRSTHQKEAFLFMQYLAKKETAQKLYTESSKTRAFGAPYARKDLSETLKDNALVYPFVSQLPHASSSFFASDTYDGEGGLNSGSNVYLSNAINSIVLDNSSPGSAVGVLNDGISQIFSKYAVQ
jgi:ABC-type glycerol-3-phosphate transport system substrate-binding protein